MNLPTDLRTALESRMKDRKWVDAPRLVALGALDDFLLITQNNAAVWSLSNYRTLGKMLDFSRTQAEGIESVNEVTLHPYRFQCFVAQSKNGTMIFENLPPHSQKDMDLMRVAVKNDTEAGNQQVRKPQRSDSLSHQATLRREWSNQQYQIQREASQYKMQLKLSLSISTASIAKLFG